MTLVERTWLPALESWIKVRRTCVRWDEAATGVVQNRKADKAITLP